MKRINAIAKYILDDDKVIDVGCDHAYLSMILAKRGIYSIASDLRENIIENSYDVAKSQKIDKFIDFRCGNGLDVLTDEDNVDVAVLSGMGSYLIIDILKRSKYTFKKVITISNREHEYLRSEMLKLGYKVFLEEIIYEKNKFYNLILFVPGKTKYSKEELVIGINHQNYDLLLKKNKMELDKINKILISKDINNKKLIRKKEILEKYLYKINI